MGKRMAPDGTREVVEGHLVGNPVVLWRIFLKVCHICSGSHWFICLFLADGVT